MGTNLVISSNEQMFVVDGVTMKSASEG